MDQGFTEYIQIHTYDTRVKSIIEATKLINKYLTEIDLNVFDIDLIIDNYGDYVALIKHKV